MKPCFGSVLHRLRVFQVGFLSTLLTLAVEHPVIGFHDLEDNLAVGVVEKKVGGQQITSTDGHLIQSSAEVEK